MTTLTEGKYAGEFLLSEAAFHRSRDNITIVSGAGNLPSGRVLATVAAGTATSAAKSGGNTGNGTFTLDVTTPVLAGAKSGIYTVRCITAAVNGGTFRVEDPDGNVLGDVAVGATFSDDIKFVIADGAADFIVGDGFDVTVNASAKSYTAHNPAGTDGSQLASAVLLYPADATSAAVKTVGIVRDAEVKLGELTYHASTNTDPLKAAVNDQLAKAGVIVR